jgi:hypothetical protein
MESRNHIHNLVGAVREPPLFFLKTRLWSFRNPLSVEDGRLFHLRLRLRGGIIQFCQDIWYLIRGALNDFCIAAL